MKRVIGLVLSAAVQFAALTGLSAVSDKFTPVDTGAVKLEGWIGRYVNGLPESFLLRSNLPAPYIEAVEQHEDTTWESEHLGKWLETACATWKYTGRDDLRQMIDITLERMLSAQEPDGWLGGYEESLRFHQVNWNRLAGPSSLNECTPGWDLWCNLMSLEGLLKYDQTFSESNPALSSAARIGDLVVKTFGPGRQDITRVPHDNGIGAMTWLLGAVQLYQKTGQARYLDFCRYIISQFGRPATMPLLLARSCSPASETFPYSEQGAVVKHSEFELILRALCGLYRSTGDPIYLETCRHAYEAGYAPLLPTLCLAGYLGTQPGQRAPSAVRERVEMCDIPCLLRWWVEMFRLTGEARFLEAIEREVYNQLLAQRTVSGLTCPYLNARHFTSPSGVIRRYRELDPFHCCFSMGPLGLSDLPSWTYFQSEQGLLVNFYEPSTFQGRIAGVPVRVRIRTEYPLDGRIDCSIEPEKMVTFALQLRIPSWCSDGSVKVNAKELPAKPAAGTLYTIAREWKPGDRVELLLPMPARARFPAASWPDHFIIERGPLVLAMTQRFNSEEDGWCYASPVLERDGSVRLEQVSLVDPANQAKTGWQARVRRRSDVNGKIVREESSATLVPFSDAGLELEPYVAAFPTVDALEFLPPRLAPEGQRPPVRLAGVTANSGIPGYEAACATDGSRESSWQPLPEPVPNWIEVWLTEPKVLTRAVLRFGDRSAHPVDFEITTWAGSERRMTLPVYGCTLSDYYWTRLAGQPVDRVRVTISKMSGDNEEGGISEIELFAD